MEVGLGWDEMTPPATDLEPCRQQNVTHAARHRLDHRKRDRLNRREHCDYQVDHTTEGSILGDHTMYPTERLRTQVRPKCHCSWRDLLREQDETRK